MSFSSFLAQFWPSSPQFTEKDLTSQAGRVFIVTGGNQGVGFELIKMLYPTGATIYMASRSKERAEKAIQSVVATDPFGASRIKFLRFDLDDLATVRDAAKCFSDQEERLDILWQNAGIGGVPIGSKTKQGIEAHIGVNVIGPLLFAQLLLPKLRNAASLAPKNSVRIIWTSSFLMEGSAPPGGYDLKELEKGGNKDPNVNYAVSKAANWMLANEAGQRFGKDGIMSVCQNPGNLNTHIYHTQTRILMFFLRMLLYPPKLGAYTELFAGLTGEITEDSQGAYIIPWGKIQRVNPRKDISQAMAEGKGKILWDWCEAQIRAHS